MPCDCLKFETLGPARGAATDDHETVDVRCLACGKLYVSTIWKTDCVTELDPMPAAQQAKYTTARSA